MLLVAIQHSNGNSQNDLPKITNRLGWRCCRQLCMSDSQREESLALALELTGSSNSKKKILCQLIKFAEVDQVVPALVDTASTL